MKFDELDARMRIYETTHDQWVLPRLVCPSQDIYIKT
jgi:hypothetical protein